MAHAISTIMIALHYYISTAAHPSFEQISVQNSIRGLLDDGILQMESARGCYQVTPKGTAWIETIRRTPYPVQKWVGRSVDE